MRKIAAMSFCVIVLALVYTLAQAQQRPLVQQPQIVTVAPSLTVWEYSSLSFNEGQTQQFNTLGNQGWELVAVTPLQTVGVQVTNYVAYFKRPRLR